jgi:hypothetical protein
VAAFVRLLRCHRCLTTRPRPIPGSSHRRSLLGAAGLGAASQDGQ